MERTVEMAFARGWDLVVGIFVCSEFCTESSEEWQLGGFIEGFVGGCLSSGDVVVFTYILWLGVGVV